MLTAVVPYILRVDMTDWAGNAAYAEYSSFVVGGAASNYTLASLGYYSGTAGKDAQIVDLLLASPLLHSHSHLTWHLLAPVPKLSIKYDHAVCLINDNTNTTPK